MLRAEYPNLPIICRSRDVADAVLMEQYGAHYAVPELFEGSLQLGASLLRVLGIPEHEIRAVTQSHREEAYEAYDPQRVTKPA
jgi:voltage-gated potassium channel Kch